MARYKIVTYMHSVVSVIDANGPEERWVVPVPGEQGHWEPTGTYGPVEIAHTLDHGQIVRLLDAANARERTRFSLDALP